MKTIKARRVVSNGDSETLKAHLRTLPERYCRYNYGIKARDIEIISFKTRDVIKTQCC